MICSTKVKGSHKTLKLRIGVFWQTQERPRMAICVSFGINKQEEDDASISTQDILVNCSCDSVDFSRMNERSEQTCIHMEWLAEQKGFY